MGVPGMGTSFMSANANCLAGDGGRESQGLTLWNLHENLSRLTDDLAEAARLFDKAAPQAGSEQRAIDTMTPRAFFASLLGLRRIRERHFGIELFGEPAWDIMLQLMIARIDQRDLRVGELCASAASSPEATFQYINELVDAKLVDRFENAADTGDFFLSLSSEAARRMAELYRARMRG